MLPLFTRTIRDVLDEFGVNSERWILNNIVSKFRGKVAGTYITRLTQFNTIEELLRDLKIHYGVTEGADKVLADLRIIRQNPGEGADDFGLRVQTLHNRLLNIYDSDNKLHPWERKTYKDNADIEALEQFIYGLRSPLEYQVRSKDPRTFSHAISEAVAIERLTSARQSVVNSENSNLQNTPLWAQELLCRLGGQNIIPQSIPTTSSAAIRLAPAVSACGYCHSSGHEEQNCKKKNYDTKACEFCKLRGHLYSECYALENAIRSGRVSQDKLEKPVEQTSAEKAPMLYAPYPVQTLAPVAYPAMTAADTEPRNNYRNSNNQYNNSRNNNYNRNGNQQSTNYRNQGNRRYDNGRNSGRFNGNNYRNNDQSNNNGSNYRRNNYRNNDDRRDKRSPSSDRIPQQNRDESTQNHLNSQGARRFQPAPGQ